MFFDDINGTDGALANGLKQTQAAAKKFVKDALKKDVRIGIFTASGAQTVEFTADEAQILDAISELKAHVKMKDGGSRTALASLRTMHSGLPTRRT